MLRLRTAAHICVYVLMFVFPSAARLLRCSSSEKLHTLRHGGRREGSQASLLFVVQRVGFQACPHLLPRW